MIGITSFSKEGYEAYGHNFLKYIDNWPGKIILYLESPIDFEHPKLEKRDFFSIYGVNNFLSILEKIPKANGVVIQKSQKRYNYNFDIWKFCRKMFCQFDAFEEGGKMYWLDSDIELKKDISEEWLGDLFDGEPLVILGRKGFHSETGLVGFDTDNKDFEWIMDRYIATLKQGLIFNMKRWHDCEALDWARDGKGKDLSPFWKIGDDLNVWPKTVLEEYMTHRKGNLKNECNK